MLARLRNELGATVVVIAALIALVAIGGMRLLSPFKGVADDRAPARVAHAGDSFASGSLSWSGSTPVVRLNREAVDRTVVDRREEVALAVPLEDIGDLSQDFALVEADSGRGPR